MYEEGDNLFLVYEELHGGSLLDMLNHCIKTDTRLSNEEIGTITYQLAAVVHFMH
jgi:serine/threonine protein kinase